MSAPTAADRQRLQMADVARLAGVSISTVSRALNGNAMVSAQTRQRVSDLAQALNYSIDVGAQNLRLRQNCTVAVVLPFDRHTHQLLIDPFAESMLDTLADALGDHGYTMQLLRLDAECIEAIAQLHTAGRAIGILLLGQWRHQEQLDALAVRGFPMAVWGAAQRQQLYCTVGSDNVAGGAAATSHLLAVGCTRIAFFGDLVLPEVAQRYEGHSQALGAAGLSVDPRLLVATGLRAADARQATLELLRRGLRFDAIFACSDALAIATMSTLREMKVRVPADIAVVGYDDIELARYVEPPLTTVRQPIQAAGRALVDALVARVAGKRPHPLLLPNDLAVRASSQRSVQRAVVRRYKGIAGARGAHVS